MKIRAITAFFDPAGEAGSQMVARLGRFKQAARGRFEGAGYEVQTTRLATTPFPGWLPSDRNDALRVASSLEQAARQAGFAYLGLGPALPGLPAGYELVLALLEATQDVFMGGVIANLDQGISLPAVRACARIIERAATLTPDGFTNLRFTALANVPPWGPFFPAAHAGAGGPAFALAMEAADAAVNAFSQAGSLADARRGLLMELERNAGMLEEVGASLEAEFRVAFKGIDFSLAPFPQPGSSIGNALEQLGVARLGLAGSLGTAAFLADTLDRGRWKRTGFNGLMLPVLEDSTLAQRSGQPLSVKDMLLFSAVCGTGLDTVPLPGDASAAQLEGLLLDVAALSLRLNKPLTARLMPVPGKRAGEMTSFDFGYFSNGQVMALDAEPLRGVLHGSENVDIRPRKIISPRP
jgi:uncharacterized protein